MGLERGRPTPGPDGTTKYFEGFITDITERKLLEAQVFQGQRLESIGTLAGGIAHDLNNVFAPIMMAGDLLGERVVEKDGAQLLNVDLGQRASAARSSSARSSSSPAGWRGRGSPSGPKALFEEIRTLPREHVPEVDPHRLRGRARTRPPSPATRPSSTSCSSTSPSTRATPCPRAEGSRSPRSPRRSPRPPRAPTRTRCPGHFVRIDVADTGSGIPDTLKGQIFDPFFTTKGVGRGSGLGLSTARSIVKAHRGFITFVSTEGVGTTFSIFLPTADSGLGQPARGASAHDARAPARQRGAHPRRRRRGVGAPHHAQLPRELRVPRLDGLRTAPRPWRSPRRPPSTSTWRSSTCRCRASTASGTIVGAAPHAPGPADHRGERIRHDAATARRRRPTASAISWTSPSASRR